MRGQRDWLVIPLVMVILALSGGPSAQAEAAMPAAALAADLTCSAGDYASGICGEVSGGGVNVWDEISNIVEPANETGPSGGLEGSGDSGGSESSSSDSQPSLGMLCNEALGGRLPDYCRTLTPVGVTNAGAPGTPATPGRSITITDLARFVPAGTSFSAEPQNVAVVGLPANFVSTARTEMVPGTILGRALTIRFTPVSFLFDYGDGERRESTTPGTPWDAAGQPQFTPTDTSHVYKLPGTFTATVTVTYNAEIDLGSGWQPITGTLTGSPASQDIRVVKARTALVQGTCAERPTAPGC